MSSKLSTVLDGLAAMSPEIADPSRHEKLLSFLQEQIALIGAHRIVAEFNAFAVIENCLTSPDDRLHSLAFRFLGYLIESSTESDSKHSNVFEILQKQQASILKLLIQRSISFETPSPLIHGCLVTIASFCQSTRAADWLMHSKEAPIKRIVWRAFADESIYVAGALTHLLKVLITRPKPLLDTNTSSIEMDVVHHELLASLIVSGNLIQIFEACLTNRDWRRLIGDAQFPVDTCKIAESALEKRILVLTLVWELCVLEDRGARQFLKDSNLIPLVLQSYAVETDRLVLSRMMDIFNQLFQSESFSPAMYFNSITPHSTLFRSIGMDVACFLEFGLSPLLLETTNLTNLAKATQMLRVIGVALSREPSKEMKSGDDAIIAQWYSMLILSAFQIVFLDVNSVASCDAYLNKDSLDQNDMNRASLKLIKMVDAVAANFLQLVQETLSVNATAPSRQRQRLQTTLLVDLGECLGSCLKCRLPTSKDLEDATVSSMLSSLNIPLRTVVKLRQTALKNLFLFVESAAEDLESDKVEKIIETCLSLLEDMDQGQTTLNLVLSMIPNCFKFKAFSFQSDAGIKLTESISTRMYDMEWDIRAATIVFLVSLFDSNPAETLSIRSAFGLQFLKNLLSRCKDMEPNVRFEALTAFQSIIHNSACWKYLVSENILDSLVRACMDEHIQDSEALVRRSAVDLLASFVTVEIFDLALLLEDEETLSGKLGEGMMQTLILDDSDWEVRICALRLLRTICERVASKDRIWLPWVSHMKPDILLTKATKDSSRLVRMETCSIISKFLNFGDIELFRGLVSNLCKVDLQILHSQAQAEYMYEEALDVDKSLIQEGDALNEGNNVLHCYDC